MAMIPIKRSKCYVMTPPGCLLVVQASQVVHLGRWLQTWADRRLGQRHASWDHVACDGHHHHHLHLHHKIPSKWGHGVWGEIVIFPLTTRVSQKNFFFICNFFGTRAAKCLGYFSMLVKVTFRANMKRNPRDDARPWPMWLVCKQLCLDQRHQLQPKTEYHQDKQIIFVLQTRSSIKGWM